MLSFIGKFCSTSVLFFIAGYTFLTSGLVATRNSLSASARHLLCSASCVLIFWILGYAFGFSQDPSSRNAFIGYGNFALQDATDNTYSHFLTSLIFVSGSVNIVAGKDHVLSFCDIEMELVYYFTCALHYFIIILC